MTRQRVSVELGRNNSHLTKMMLEDGTNLIDILLVEDITLKHGANDRSKLVITLRCDNIDISFSEDS